MFLIDASDSSTGTDFDRSVDFVRGIASKLDIGSTKTRVGVATITDSGESPVYLSGFSDKQYLLNAIDTGVTYRGGTGAFARSLQRVRTDQLSPGNGARDKIPDVLVIVASETLNIGGADVKSEISQLRELGVFIIMIVYGDTVSKNAIDDSLVSIVADPLESNRFTPSSSADLNTVSDDVLKRLCEEIPGDWKSGQIFSMPEWVFHSRSQPMFSLYVSLPA